eukprot:5061535-Ditylum_brightwellii.AAC.1
MRETDHNLSKLFLYNDAPTDIALLLGNDYLKQIHSNGPVTVICRPHTGRESEDKLGLIDSIDSRGDAERWIEDYAKQHAAINDNLEYVANDKRACQYMKHAPVFEEDEATEA